jgi:hypothetical protein
MRSACSGWRRSWLAAARKRDLLFGGDRAQADLDRNLAPVRALGPELHAGAHRSWIGIRHVGTAVGDMVVAQPLWQQHLDRLADEAFRGLVEHRMGLLIRDPDDAICVNDDHGVGRGLDEIAVGRKVGRGHSRGSMRG